MCGRFSCSLNPETIKSQLEKEDVLNDTNVEWIDQEKHKSSYNVCPTRFIPVLYERGDNKQKFIQSMYWGFIPSWSKSLPMNKPINARSETLVENTGSIFDKSKNATRCIIVAEGFYEWNKKRQPFYVKRKDGQLMLFAGLYSSCVINGEKTTTCVIITTSASDFFSKIHDRIPVILEPSQVNQWLDNTKLWNHSVINLLKPYQGELDCYRVSEDVGPTKNDSPDLNTPLDQNKNSISHFLKPVDKSVEINKAIQPAKSNQPIKGYAPESEPKTDSKMKSNNTTEVSKRKSTSEEANKKSKTPKITSFFKKD